MLLPILLELQVGAGALERKVVLVGRVMGLRDNQGQAVMLRLVVLVVLMIVVKVEVMVEA